MPPPLPLNSVTETAQAVLTFLQNVGQRRDIEAYFKLFRGLPQESFAVIALEQGVIESSAGLLAQHLKYLGELGIYPCLMLGFDRGGPTGKLASGVLDALRQARVVAEGVRAELPSAQSTERVGELLKRGVVPVVWLDDAASADGFQYLAQLVAGLSSRKLVILRADGGLGRQLPPSSSAFVGRDRPALEGGLSIINLGSEFDSLMESQQLGTRDTELLRQVRQIVGELQPLTDAPTPTAPPVVNVTSPLNLLRELFTVRGAGTLIKAGPSITRFSGYANLDVERLRRLLESTFDRRLRDDFFDLGNVDVFLEAGYRGAAIIDPHGGVPCLTKFAVDRLAQGEGLGRDLWSTLRRHYARLCWRARSGNPVIDWYSTLCDSMVKGEPFSVFGVGLRPDELPALVQELQRRPDDFGDVLTRE